MRIIQKTISLFLFLLCLFHFFGCHLFEEDERYVNYIKNGRAEAMLEEKVQQIMDHLESAGVLTQDIVVMHDYNIHYFYSDDPRDYYLDRDCSFAFFDERMPRIYWSVAFYPDTYMGANEDERFQLSITCRWSGVSSAEEIDFNLGAMSDLMDALLSSFNAAVTVDCITSYLDRTYLLDGIKGHFSFSNNEGSCLVYEVRDSYSLSSFTSLTVDSRLEEKTTESTTTELFEFYWTVQEQHWQSPAKEQLLHPLLQEEVKK